MNELLTAVVLEMAAYIVFAFVFLGFFCAFFVVGMAVVLLAQAGYRWLKHHTWNYVILRLHARALR